ncbi:hypothetical protein N9P82_00190, partial [bacterium]|nr:hypothetical protein [bacterium]
SRAVAKKTGSRLLPPPDPRSWRVSLLKPGERFGFAQRCGRPFDPSPPRRSRPFHPILSSPWEP